MTLGERPADASTTGWWVVASVGAVVALLGSALAVRHVRSWPEMGTRYDAPTAAAAPDPAQMEDLDLWRAIDEGRDPTDPTDAGDPTEPGEPSDRSKDPGH